MDNPFLDLIRKNNGFEYVIGFRNDVDHILGGTGNTVWYCICKGRTMECWIGDCRNGIWTDRHLVKKKGTAEEPAESGTAMAMILDRAYFKQAEIAETGRKPVKTELSGHPCSHYVYSFGARAYEILDDFGITVSYSNVDDEPAGYRLRNILTGSDVRLPQL